jgi:lipoprotein-anchoring transpeptidase ErfK/SrfK
MLRPGESSDSVRGLQTRLADLGYWLGRPDGNFGTLTQQAVIAFQGAEGLARDGIVGPQTTRALATAEPPRARSEGGNLIEIDEDRGLLLVVQNGEVELALHTSTGTDQTYISPTGGTNVADTPDGRWSIAWAFDGWREGPLGRMWRPRYFHSDGVAIHGYESVPPYPASHGCARVSMAAMDLIWARDLAPEGGTVWVY